MTKYLIKNGTLVNEGKSLTMDILLQDGIIQKIDKNINKDGNQTSMVYIELQDILREFKENFSFSTKLSFIPKIVIKDKKAIKDEA